MTKLLIVDDEPGIVEEVVDFFKEEGFDKNRKIIGSFLASGLIPTFIEKFERRGIKIPRTLFSNEQAQSKKMAAVEIKQEVGFNRIIIESTRCGLARF